MLNNGLATATHLPVCNYFALAKLSSQRRERVTSKLGRI